MIYADRSTKNAVKQAGKWKYYSAFLKGISGGLIWTMFKISGLLHRI